MCRDHAVQFFFTVGQISYLPAQPVEVQIGAVCTYRQKTTQSYAYNMYNQIILTVINYQF